MNHDVCINLETTTVWSFPERGAWATHNPNYRGNWAPQIPRNLILKYTKEGDLILDPFIGSGTTAVVAKALGRNWVGIEKEKKYVDLANRRVINYKVK